MAGKDSIMCSEMMRYSTFCGFQTPAGVWPSHLAKAGFYHPSSCGDNQQLVCFHCGLKVDVRSLVGQPLAETHERLSPNCGYAAASSGNRTKPSLITPASSALQPGSIQQGNAARASPSYSFSGSQTSNQRDIGSRPQQSFSSGAGYNTSPPPSFYSSEPSVPILNSGAEEHQHLPTMPLGFMSELPSATVDSLFTAGLLDHSGLSQSSGLANALLGGPADVMVTDGEPESPAEDPRLITSEATSADRNSPRQQQVSSAPAHQTEEKNDNAPRKTVGFSDLGIIVERPKRRDMAMYHRRLETLENWVEGHHLTQSNESIAEAGFYYAGYSDCCRCFYCGGGLKSWTESDVPWVEHARWFKTCPFVRTSKGQDFIDTVQSLARSAKIITMDDVTNEMNNVSSSWVLPSNVTEDEEEDLSDMEDESDQTRGMCKICLDKEVSVLYVPCGHLVTCASCSPTMKNCPVCRQVIRGQVRVQMNG